MEFKHRFLPKVNWKRDREDVPVEEPGSDDDSDAVSKATGMAIDDVLAGLRPGDVARVRHE